MKKIIYFLLLLGLTACNNPFDKYVDSFDAIAASASLAAEVQEIDQIITNLSGDLNNLDETSMTNLLDSLSVINTNLDNPQVVAILSSYATQYGVSLEDDTTEIQTQLANIAASDRDGDSNTTDEEQVVALLATILGKL